jgi:general secretion pathway protein E
MVAMVDPTDRNAIGAIVSQCGMTVSPAVSMRSDIAYAIDKYYRVDGQVDAEIKRFSSEAASKSVPEEASTRSAVEDAPIVRTVDLLLKQAMRDRASDIHVEPQADSVRIRYRIDGVLHDVARLPTGSHEPLVSRLKVIAQMDLVERRRPQDGQFVWQHESKSIDIRASTCPTAHGETIVLRILDKAESLSDLRSLGLSREGLDRYTQMLSNPFGMLLVAGPTGSGKTTTLYASINELDAVEQNIVTIEDPIECMLPQLKQISVNEKAGITFASGLRSIMRLDPDVIMVGEIRDPETAKTAVQAALTGHLVLASTHATDTTRALLRLVDLGVDPCMVASAVIGVASQRMCRKICPQCGRKYIPNEDESIAFESEIGDISGHFRVGTGCALCAGTGYFGRTGIFELLLFDGALRRMLVEASDSDRMREYALQNGMTSIKKSGMLKAQAGVTTPREVLRAVHSLS